MRRIQRKKKKLFLITSLIVIALPIVIWNILTQSLDIRNRAASPENSPDTGCTITIPNVNSQTIPLNSKIHVEVQIDKQKIPDPIKNIIIINNRNEVVFTATEDKSKYVFSIIPKTLGELEFYGSANTDKENVVCVYKDARKSAKVVKGNIAPDFVTNPYVNAIPSNNIKINEKYEYRLIANDKDHDKIRHLFIFSKKFPWLNEKVEVSGENGNLELLFSGKSSKPGSYLASVFIYDGYNNHVKSQNWIINVEDQSVSIPHIYIEKAILKDKTFTITWDIESKFQITKEAVFITQSPSNPDKWILVKDDLSGNSKSIDIDMSKYEDGIYAVIIKAFDSQKPARYGLGVTPQMLEYKSTTTQSKPASDIVQLEYPQILKISPKEDSHIEDTQPAIQATLIPSRDSAIIKESVSLKIDNQVITDILNNPTDTEMGINITFIPKTPLTVGEHTVTISFQDTSKKEASKTWKFTIDQRQGIFQTIRNLFKNKQAGMIMIIGFFIILLTFIITVILYIKQKTQKPKTFIPNLPQYKKTKEYEGQTFNSAVDPFSRIEATHHYQQTTDETKTTQSITDISNQDNRLSNLNNKPEEKRQEKEPSQQSNVQQQQASQTNNQATNIVPKETQTSQSLNNYKQKQGNNIEETEKPLTNTSTQAVTLNNNNEEEDGDNMIRDMESLVTELQQSENKKLSFLEDKTGQNQPPTNKQQLKEKQQTPDTPTLQTNDNLVPNSDNNINPPTVL